MRKRIKSYSRPRSLKRENIHELNDFNFQEDAFGDGPVLVHSDALNTLRLVPRNRDLNELADSHIKRINQMVDDRSIWMPAFNYSFPSSKMFNITEDASEVGLISERFRTQSAWRTKTPIFNFSGNGEEPLIPLETEKPIDPFDKDSAFGFLTKNHGSILWYGAPIASATILHFVESGGNKPPYRYDKVFTGKVQTQDKMIDISLKYHVRPRSGPLGYDWTRLNADAFESGVIRKVKLEQEADIYACTASELVDFWNHRYEIDPFYFLDPASRAWTEPMVEKLGRRFEIQDFEEIQG